MTIDVQQDSAFSFKIYRPLLHIDV